MRPRAYCVRGFVQKWGARDVREIGKTDVLAALDAIVEQGTPSAANHALAAVRKFFNWCRRRTCSP